MVWFVVVVGPLGFGCGWLGSEWYHTNNGAQGFGGSRVSIKDGSWGGSLGGCRVRVRTEEGPLGVQGGSKPCHSAALAAALPGSEPLFRGGAVARTTKQTMVLPDTPISFMKATAFPAMGTPIAGNVAMAKQETVGAAHD
ncbi:hypothetical protein E2C01_092533 [Portunus trituberculatus]|uniref:Uncharacterized protein n=1 Tax=Portunus trituberculatus TaxID=210409 RepID=A0A5B7JQT8_PORTR|nr:hypothetical protein [Portunus trituberculatus]